MDENIRKQKEASFHDEYRGGKMEKEDPKRYRQFLRRKRFYSVVKRSEDFIQNFLKKNCKDKRVLDCGCGEGRVSIFLAENGAEAFGIDISPETIKVAQKKAAERNLTKISFLVQDVENLKFPDNYFDIIVCAGILHHLDIKKVYPGLSRVLKPEGKVICNEPLIHNPIFQLYRRMTPHLRTAWEAEHILSKKDIKLAENYFSKVEKRFFHLFSLAAVPFFGRPAIFKIVLGVLSSIDYLVLKIPFVRWWAWQIVFILSEPKK